MRVDGIEVVREPLIAGMTDENGEPVHAIMFGGVVYMEPEKYDRLVAEIEERRIKGEVVDG